MEYSTFQFRDISKPRTAKLKFVLHSHHSINILHHKRIFDNAKHHRAVIAAFRADGSRANAGQANGPKAGTKGGSSRGCGIVFDCMKTNASSHRGSPKACDRELISMACY